MAWTFDSYEEAESLLNGTAGDFISTCLQDLLGCVVELVPGVVVDHQGKGAVAVVPLGYVGLDLVESTAQPGTLFPHALTLKTSILWALSTTVCASLQLD